HVIALEVIVDVIFPVAGDVVVVMAMEGVGVERSLAQPRVDPGHDFRERHHGIERRERESAPFGHGRFRQTDRGGIEIAYAVHFGRAQQAAIQRVAPAMVVAAQALGVAAVTGRQRTSAMAADVVQGAQRAVVPAHQQQRHASDVRNDVVAGIGKLVGTREPLPAVREDRATVAFEAFGAGVKGRGKRRGAFQLLRCGVLIVGLHHRLARCAPSQCMSSRSLNAWTVPIKASARRVTDAVPSRGYPRMSAQPKPSGRRHAGIDGSDYRQVRDATLALCATLAPEDTVAQSMPDASPAKWHLAHTTWFFEQFLLAHFEPGYRRFHNGWDFLFNSYYQTVGPMHARPQRGLLTRPTLDEVAAYRAHVDDAMGALLRERGDDPEVIARVTLGLNHEQQHQELLLTDIQHLFSLNPLQPVFREMPATPETASVPLRFIAGRQGIAEIGHADEGFAYDNESPRHRELLHPHAIANRCVTNAEFREFIDDGG